MKALYLYVLESLRGFDALEVVAKPLAVFVMLTFIFFVAWFAFFITKRIIIKIVQQVAKRTKTDWDDILVKHKVFSGIAHFVPVFILYHTCGFASPTAGISVEVIGELSNDYYLSLEGILIKIAQLYFIVTIINVLNSALNAVNEIYNTTEYSHHRPIKGYIQLLKILIFFMAGILIVSILLSKDPTVLLAGLGAMAAILLLIFKDTILGFVASIQLSANNMVKIGDWIEMPGHKADGTVIDITLNTVKVQNWDKTIATIPTYSLIAESFNNWEGMEQSEGRRIKRSIAIDMGSVKFCDYDLLKKFEKFDLIKEYVISKQKEIDAFNNDKKLSSEDKISGRNQTNIGIFRRYLEVYLHNHPMINTNMTFLVRQLQPTEIGLPIEIYVFSKDKRWANYESIQADIFDHILAIIPEFELKAFQAPSGEDVRVLASGNNRT